MFWLSRHVALGDPDYGRNRILAELLFLGIAVTLLVVRVRWLIPALVVLVCVQRWVSEADTFRTFPAAAAYPRLTLLEPLQHARGPYRVVGKKGAFPPAMNIFYGLEDPRGYEAMTYAPYWHTFPLWSGPHGVWYNHVEALEAPFLSFLNVRFAIQDQADAIPDGWHVVTTANGAKLLENDRVIERIFVPQQVALHAMSPQEVVERMSDAKEFRSVTWIDSPDVTGVRDNGPGRITLRSRSRGGAYTFDANMQNEGWVVISDAAWRGWRATVDGRRADLRHANAAFLAVLVPRGHHRVRLTYVPSSFVIGAGLTFATVLALVFFGVRRPEPPLW
jgi:hypothetical protein